MPRKVRPSPPNTDKDDAGMADSMPRPSSRRLDPYGRITIHPRFRRILDGPIEQRETEEGILLRPAPETRPTPHASSPPTRATNRQTADVA